MLFLSLVCKKVVIFETQIKPPLLCFLNLHFTKVVGNNTFEPTPQFVMHMRFLAPEEERQRLKSTFGGKVVVLRSSNDIQNIFYVEGYFHIKVTPLGDNLCLLEEVDKGEI